MDVFDIGEIVSESPIKEKVKVPNEFPSIEPSTYRIAICGEAPGLEEESQGKPFVGQSGRMLDKCLSSAGIVRASCFVGNVCQQRPPKNDINSFEFDGAEIQEGLTQLSSDLQRYAPNLVVLLGKTALYAAKGTKNISDWRGSFFISDREPFKGYKCIASFHPAYCLRQYDNTPLLMWDLVKAKEEGKTHEWKPPVRDIKIDLSYQSILDQLQAIKASAKTISYDIEGGIDSISCIGIATSPVEGFVVPFIRLDGSHVWSLDEEAGLWRAIAEVMADSSVKKIAQNSLYDRFVLQFSQQILIRGNEDDTMLHGWEYGCELDKNLGFLNSLFTKEPFYKMERKSEDDQVFLLYCGKDACTTYEINEKLKTLLPPLSKEHYKDNNSALNFLLYAELRGIRYDQTEANKRLALVQCEIDLLQVRLDKIAGDLGAIPQIDWTQSHEAILQKVQETCCHKREQTKPKKDYEETYPEVEKLLRSKQGNLEEAEKAHVSRVLGFTLNIRSHKKFHDFLYITCGLPTQWKKDPSTKEMKRTANYESLLRLSKTHTHPVLPIVKSMALHLSRRKMLSIKSHNGRMHCGYNLVGSETGRITSSKSVIGGFGKDRVGTNLQTIPDDWDLEDESELITEGLRDLYLADEGCDLGKCDLKGSDGWTIGAYMALLGDDTMLEDLKYGLKPAQIVAYIMRHGVDQYLKIAKDRTALKEALKEIKKEDWDYFCCKCLIWGFAYLLGVKKASEMIFVMSEGKINLSQKQTQVIKDAVFVRYRMKIWHDWMTKFLTSQPYPAKLTAPNGFTRKFFGRNGALKGQQCEILGEALAHMPQVVTTMATVTAARRLWNDPDNRLPIRNATASPDTSTASIAATTNVEPTSSSFHGPRGLRVEPLHQVHDELLMQWKKEDRSWAIDKIKSWFNNPITIVLPTDKSKKVTFTIPFEGTVCSAWSAAGEHYIQLI